MSGEQAAKVRRRWEAFAPRYDRAMRWCDRLVGDGRQQVASRATGQVLEVGIGTGLNLPFYPSEVQLTGLDLSPAMLAVARERAASLGRDVTLLEGDAQALPFPDASFDTVVSTLALCEVPDERVVIEQMWRVLRPGGQLLLLDHVVSSWWPIRLGQRLLEAMITRASGEHLTRRPLLVVRAAGFTVTQTQRWKAGLLEWVAAVKPPTG